VIIIEPPLLHVDNKLAISGSNTGKEKGIFKSVSLWEIYALFRS
jgi:hypothetical protein